MSLARLVITALKIEGRSKREVARDYGISRYGVQLNRHGSVGLCDSVVVLLILRCQGFPRMVVERVA